MKKQANTGGRLYVSSNPKYLPGTMFNPFQSASLGEGTVFLPKSMISSDPSKTELRALIFHSLALVGTYGVGAAGLSYLNDMFTSRIREQSREGTIKPGIQASRVPLLQSETFDKQAQAVEQAIDQRKWFKYGLILPWTAMALGVAGGLKVGGEAYRAEREVELDDQIANNAQKLDDLTMKRLEWARKTAQAGRPWWGIPDFISAGGTDLGSMGMAAIAGTFGISALASYIMARKRDPNIARNKTLEQGFKELTRSQSRRTSSSIRPFSPETTRRLDAITAGKQRPEITATTVEAVPVDTTDQSMKLL